MDSYADILADAKKMQNEAARALLVLQRGGPVPDGMAHDEAVGILRENILLAQGIIDKLGFRGNA